MTPLRPRTATAGTTCTEATVRKTGDVRLELRLDKAATRRWQLDLLDALARKPGIRPSVSWAETAGPAAPGATPLLFAIERALDRVPGGGPASRVAPAAFSRHLGEASGTAGAEAPDRVLDFCGPLGQRPTPTWFVTVEGGFGETGILAALSAGRLPLVRIVDAANGRVSAAARPGTERGGAVLTAFEDCLHRTATFVVAALDGAARCLPAHLTPAALSPGPERISVGRSLAGMPARKLKHAAYRSLCHAPHWRVGWRRVAGPDIFDALALPDTTWNDLPDDGHRFYADPFPVVHRDRTFLFVEEFDHGIGRGVISAVEFGEAGPLGAPEPVLSSCVHLSYPFVFEEDGEMWMVPESSQAGTIDLYRARRFPGGWRHEATLVAGVEAGDATLFRRGDRWWMAATVRDGGGSYSDALHLWSARSFRGPWTPHRGNPVLIDAASARPAGRVVERGGRLIRPVQDCRRGYGAALALAEITRLDDDRFEQSVISVLEPGASWPGRRLHTVNRAGGWEFIDGSAVRFRPAPATALRRAGPLGRVLLRRAGV